MNSRVSANAGVKESMDGGSALRVQAAVPLTSVEHGHTSVRPSTSKLSTNNDPSSGGSPTKSPSNRSRRESTAGTLNRRTRSNVSALSPHEAGETMESGILTTARRTGNANAIPAALSAAGGTGAAAAPAGSGAAGKSRNASFKENPNAVSAFDVAHERKGRRASRRDSAKWPEAERANRPADTELSQNVATVNDEVADREVARREQAERAQRQQEQLTQHISDPPTGFQAVLPRLSELDVTNSWDRLLRMMRNEYDMSCLTSCLARELDEDVAWNPEMLLLQLTSDMMDAAELQKDGETYVPVDASDIGRMTGGEVVRKRGEKVAMAETGAAPPQKAGPAAGLAAGSPATAAAASPENGSLRTPGVGAAGDDDGAHHSRLKASILEPDRHRHHSSRRKSSVASRAPSADRASMKSPEEGESLRTKTSRVQSFSKK